ncbi:hypothetical protein CF326_g7638, partial [Tilletia indica]
MSGVRGKYLERKLQRYGRDQLFHCTRCTFTAAEAAVITDHALECRVGLGEETRLSRTESPSVSSLGGLGTTYTGSSSSAAVESASDAPASPADVGSGPAAITGATTATDPLTAAPTATTRSTAACAAGHGGAGSHADDDEKNQTGADGALLGGCERRHPVDGDETDQTDADGALLGGDEGGLSADDDEKDPDEALLGGDDRGLSADEDDEKDPDEALLGGDDRGHSDANDDETDQTGADGAMLGGYGRRHFDDEDGEDGGEIGLVPPEGRNDTAVSAFMESDGRSAAPPPMAAPPYVGASMATAKAAVNAPPPSAEVLPSIAPPTAAAAADEPVIRPHAVFLPAFGAVICRHCRYAVDPVQIGHHMRRAHPSMLPAAVTETLQDVRDLAKTYVVNHPQNLAWPIPDATRVPYLDCRAGYQCLDCHCVDYDRDVIRRKSSHLRPDCTGAADRIVLIGSAQRWTYRAGGFQVERGHILGSSEASVSVRPAEVDRLNSELLGVVKARVEEVRRMHAASKAIPRQSNEPTPGQLRTEWAKMHEWGTVLASADNALVADLKRAPTGGGGGGPGGAAVDNEEEEEDGGFELELHWLEQQMVDIIFHAHSRASTTHDQIRYPLNHDRDDEEAAGRRKFGVTMDSTAKTYAREFVTLIRPLLRVSRLSRAEKRRVSPVQAAYLRHQTRIDALLGAESRREIRAAFLALVAALITQPDPGPRSPSALRICLASLGVDKGRNLAWSEPWAVSKTLSAVIYDVRALAYLCFLDGYLGSDGVNEGEATIQEAIELTRPLQKLGGAVGRVTPSSSQGSGSSLGIPPTEAQLVAVERAEAAAIRHFLDARRRFLNLSSGTAVSYYHRLRTYTLKTTYRPFDRFDADEKGVTFDGSRVLYASFAPVAKGMLEDVLEAMEEVLLHRELGTEPWHVDIGSLKDNLTDTSTGYSFLAHPSNRDALKAGPSMLERALPYFFDRPGGGGGGGDGDGDETGDEDEDDAEKGELERRGFNVVRAKKWLRKVRKMLVRLAVLLMFVCGPAVRGTEFLFNMVKNDGDWARSNRISTGGRVFIQTS